MLAAEFLKDELDIARRFGGVSRLYGLAGLAKLQAAHVVVVGIGGVGSWAAEALARNAVGKITLIDLDNIAESNVNRQLHAVDGAFGKAKVTAMRERILTINPQCVVVEVEDFITPDNIALLLHADCNVIVDCIDNAQAKIALADYCKRTEKRLVMAGSAGGRTDPTKIQVADLAFVTGDRLLAKVRNQLRRDYGFPKASGQKKSAKFGFACVYSDEPVIKPYQVLNAELNSDINSDSCDVDAAAITGLNCAGYGASVCVTAPFGFTAAAIALQEILNN